MDEYCRLRELAAAQTASQRTEELCAETELNGKTTNMQRVQACFPSIYPDLSSILSVVQLQRDSLRQEIEASNKQVADFSSRIAQLKKTIADSETEKASVFDAREKMAR
jgi:septal ring factor EnvC (AmiA/AmiB activator)